MIGRDEEAGSLGCSRRSEKDPSDRMDRMRGDFLSSIND